MSGCSDKAGFWETFWEKSGLTRILISAAWEESKVRLSIHNICLIFVFHFSKKTSQNIKSPALIFVFYFNRHWILALFMKVKNLLSSSQIHRGSNMRMPLFSLPPPSFPSFLPPSLYSFFSSSFLLFSLPLFTIALFYCGILSEMVFGFLGVLLKRKQCSFVLVGTWVQLFSDQCWISLTKKTIPFIWWFIYHRVICIEKGQESLDDDDECRVALNYFQYISAFYRGEKNHFTFYLPDKIMHLAINNGPV